MTEKKILFNADLRQCSYLRGKTSLINTFTYSICWLLFNYRYLDRWNTHV